MANTATPVPKKIRKSGRAYTTYLKAIARGMNSGQARRFTAKRVP